MIIKFIAVCMGGFVGTGLRYAIKVVIPGTVFTMPTFISNAVGCVLLGVIISISEHSSMNDVLKIALVVGCCGALTTFSTIIYDIIKLLSQGAFTDAIIYFVSTHLMGIIMFGLGFVFTAKYIKWIG